MEKNTWDEIAAFCVKIAPHAIIVTIMFAVKTSVKMVMGVVITRKHLFLSMITSYGMAVAIGYLWETLFGDKYTVAVVAGAALIGHETLTWVYARYDYYLSAIANNMVDWFKVSNWRKKK